MKTVGDILFPVRCSQLLVSVDRNVDILLIIRELSKLRTYREV